ncbi:MAG: hypothetical protein ABFS16_16290 [Bacteroidota bacterium]
MNKIQTNQYRMFLNVQESLDANSSLWNMIPILLNTKNDLDELIQRIADVNEKTVSNSKAVTANKEVVLNSVIEKAIVLSGALQAYAAFTGNIKLAGKVKLNKSDLLRARETDVEALVAPVINEARKELDNLADYGVPEVMITELETSVDDFKALIGQPRTVRNQAFAAMTFLDELFDAANDVVKNKLDKLMIRFQFSNTEFYSEYERARTIVD